MAFKIPESVDGLDLEALRSLLTEARAAGRELSNSEDATVEQLEEIADFISTVGSKVTDAEAEVQRREVAKAAFAEPEAEVEAEAEAEVEVEAEPEAEVEAEVAEEAQVEEKVAVAASAKTAKPVAARLASKPSAPVPPRASATIIASADVPGVPGGAELSDLGKVGDAAIAKMHTFPTGRAGNKNGYVSRHPIAIFNLNREDGLTQDNPEYRDGVSLAFATAKEERLSGGSLVAAGGWCAPNETLYDLCSIESTDGIIDVPSMNVTRGGIDFTKGPTFADFYDDPDLGWDLTNAEVIAENPKPFMTITCPEFDNITLDAVGLGLKIPLLTQAAYPELVRRTIEGILIAHQHKVARRIYNDISTGSTARTVNDATTATDSLAVLELVAEYERQSWRMRFNETLEVLVPAWFRTSIRADLARRNGVPFGSVTDAQINSYFTERKMRVQWLYNTGQDIEEAGGVISVPSTIDIPMYPAGTWVKGTKDVITLDAVYDSTDLAVNTFTGLFVEEGLFIANTCFDSVKVTIPTCASGQTGAADLVSCLAASSS